MNWTREYDAVLGEEGPSAEYLELLGEIQGIREDAQQRHKETNKTIMVCVAVLVLWQAGFLGFLNDLLALLLGVITALVK